MYELTNTITGLTSAERKNCFSWVATLPEVTVIKIFQDSVNGSFKLKDERPDLQGKVVKYCAFILACRKNGWDTAKKKGYRIAGEEQFEDFTDIRQAKVAELIQRGRTPIIRRKVLAYWGEVKDFKSKGVGGRPIVKYLHKYRKIKISEAYLRKLWSEVEKND